MPFLSTLFLSLLLTVAMIPVLSKLAVRWHLLDVPDTRKVHQMPVPRCGGIAMAVGAFVPILYWYADSHFIRAFLVAGGVIVLFGVIDDFVELSPRWKLLGQIVAALIVIYGGEVQIVSLGALLPDGMLLPSWLSVPLTLLVVVGVTNAINLSDGLDGLAGGISLLAVCCIGYLAYMTGRNEIGLVCLAMAGALFGFLRFNTHPASIFMGDSGSQLLGFSAITLSLLLTQQVQAFSSLFPLLLFGIPVLDTLTVMITRIIKGRSPFSPDKTHFHHRLLVSGLSHSETVLTVYLIQAALVSATFFMRFQSEWMILSLYLLFSVAFLSFVGYAARVEEKRSRPCFPLVGYKSRLQAVRENRKVVKVVFPLLRYLLYGLMILSALIAQSLDGVAAPLAVAMGLLLLLAHFFWPKVAAASLRIVFYLVVPYAVYSGEVIPVQWLGAGERAAVSIAFVSMLVAGMVVTLVSTRQQGFRSTPLDFLVLMIVLLILILPGIGSQEQRLGMIGLHCIIFFTGYEVLVAEMRGNIRGVLAVLAVSLFVFTFKTLYWELI